MHELPAEEVLVARARRGDRAAFDQLVRQFRPRIFALALQISGGRAEAEDIVQETFLRAYRGLAAFEGRSPFRTWLYRIALNRTFSHRRRGRARNEDAQVPLDDDRVRAALAVDGADPAAAAELAETYALLLAALDRLSAPLKTAVVLVTLQQLSQREAAAIAGVSQGTIAWRIHEARRQLQRALSPISEVRRRRPGPRKSPVTAR